MTHLGIDIGSSSVKAGVVKDGRVHGKLVHAAFATRHDGVRVEVDPRGLLAAVTKAVCSLGSAARRADVIGLSVMSPAWVAMDRHGKPLTPIVTHQDRRSVGIARALEEQVGKARYLQLAGNRPFPGGMSATTWGWYLKHEPERLKHTDLVGHLNTYLHRHFTGARVTDPANASFSGLYDTANQIGWVNELCDAVGGSVDQLPQVLDSNVVGGKLTPTAASRLGLPVGMPVLTGIVDTSSAMLLIGARPGQLLNVCGSTDVLGLCTNKAHPHERLLTRALGVGKKWMSVSTLAASGSALNWAKETLFADLEPKQFWKLLASLARQTGREDVSNGADVPAPVRFEPYLAGERTSIEQRQASFSGLTLAATREQMLSAIITALAAASAARLPLLRETGSSIRRDVVVSGGARNGLDKILHSGWPGRWSFRAEAEATLRGLSKLEPREL